MPCASPFFIFLNANHPNSSRVTRCVFGGDFLRSVIRNRHRKRGGRATIFTSIALRQFGRLPGLKFAATPATNRCQFARHATTVVWRLTGQIPRGRPRWKTPWFSRPKSRKTINLTGLQEPIILIGKTLCYRIALLCVFEYPRWLSNMGSNNIPSQENQSWNGHQ